MVKRLNSSDTGFFKALEDHLAVKVETSPEINRVVAEIIENVATKGDKALLDYTEQFDGVRYAPETLRIPQERIEKAWNETSKELQEALQLAAKRIEAYHQKQLPSDLNYTDDAGVQLGWKWTAVDSAGLYVPGGQAVYPSSVLMNAIPARIAGVKKLVMVVPTPKGVLNPLVLAAAKVAGITEIYPVGGAQAIAALAYGTQTIPKVQKIVGPGNAYVAAAKRQVFGLVGIDMIAGPSEILVIADEHATPEWVAADLLSQAEHDKDARAVLVTESKTLADAVEKAVETTLSKLGRESIARESWDKKGLLVVAKSLEEAADVANRVAPEHLELFVLKPELLEKRITNAGAIFSGRYTPEAVGDYIAGPSHVLPTAGSAAYSSGLGVLDFMKRTSLISCGLGSYSQFGQNCVDLAQAEGLGAHALSVQLRLMESLKQNADK